SSISIGMQSPGTLINILKTGAVVQFYGTVRGFLPVAEMSEAFIQDPAQHFRLGQVVNVYVLSIDVDQEKLLVSCKDPSAFTISQQNALKSLTVGTLVHGKVMEKQEANIVITLEESGLKAILGVGHLTDGSLAKNTSLLKRIR